MMARRQEYTLTYAKEIDEHLLAIASKYHGLIQQTIEEQLRFEPDVKTRNRKPLREPIAGAKWELRLGPDNRFRVLYSFDTDNLEVSVLAIGEKRGNQLRIGGEPETNL